MADTDDLNDVDNKEVLNDVDNKDVLNNVDNKDVLNEVNNNVVLDVEEELEKLNKYYIGNMYMDNYNNILFNLTFKVYKNIPLSCIKKYNLIDVYFGSNGRYYIKNNKLLYDIMPLWYLCRKTFNV